MQSLWGVVEELDIRGRIPVDATSAQMIDLILDEELDRELVVLDRGGRGTVHNVQDPKVSFWRRIELWLGWHAKRMNDLDEDLSTWVFIRSGLVMLFIGLPFNLLGGIRDRVLKPVWERIARLRERKSAPSGQTSLWRRVTRRVSGFFLWLWSWRGFVFNKRIVLSGLALIASGWLLWTLLTSVLPDQKEPTAGDGEQVATDTVEPPLLDPPPLPDSEPPPLPGSDLPPLASIQEIKLAQIYEHERTVRELGSDQTNDQLHALVLADIREAAAFGAVRLELGLSGTDAGSVALEKIAELKQQLGELEAVKKELNAYKGLCAALLSSTATCGQVRGCVKKMEDVGFPQIDAITGCTEALKR